MLCVLQIADVFMSIWINIQYLTLSLLSELSISKLFFLAAMVETVVLLIVTSSGDCGDGPVISVEVTLLVIYDEY